MFADICGSTPLYADTGNLVALDLVGESLDRMGSVVHDQGGEIIRSKGDDLLCVFTDASPTLRCATAMLAQQSNAELQIRIGLHFGAVIRARDDIFGDAVNVASRLLSLGRPDEILASAEFADRLAPAEREQLRLFDRQILRGKTDPIELYTVLRQDENITEFHTLQFAVGNVDRRIGAQVVLRYADQQCICKEGGQVVTLGRATTSDLVIMKPRVSRQHAIITARGGKISLTDRSSLGTWVSGQNGNILLRRESVYLMGSGQLSLGAEPGDEDAVIVDYEQSEFDLL